MKYLSILFLCFSLSLLGNSLKEENNSEVHFGIGVTNSRTVQLIALLKDIKVDFSFFYSHTKPDFLNYDGSEAKTFYFFDAELGLYYQHHLGTKFSLYYGGAFGIDFDNNPVPVDSEITRNNEDRGFGMRKYSFKAKIEAEYFFHSMFSVFAEAYFKFYTFRFTSSHGSKTFGQYGLRWYFL